MQSFEKKKQSFQERINGNIQKRCERFNTRKDMEKREKERKVQFLKTIDKVKENER